VRQVAVRLLRVYRAITAALDALAARLRAHAETLAAALARDDRPVPSAASLRRYAELSNAPLVDLVADPGLPSALLPADWPGPTLAALIVDTHARHRPAATAYAHEVLSAA
jgi:phenylacetic acid degradation operon negative regulatory protein